MFNGKVADQRDNQVDSPNRYNVEGNNSLSLSQQPLTTGIVLKIWLFI